MKSIHVGVSQIQSKAMDVQGNLLRMHKQIQAASISGVEIILFAETCIHAYCLYPENLALAEPLGGPITMQLSRWAKQYEMVILAGMLEKSDLGIHNSHIIAHPDGRLNSVRKNNMTEFEINARIVPGKIEREPFSVNGILCSVIVCADSGVEAIYDDMNEKGVELVFMGTAGGGYRKDYLTEADMATTEGMMVYMENRAVNPWPNGLAQKKDFRMAMAAANAHGDDGVFMTHQGGCSIVDKNRVLRAEIRNTIVVDHFLDQTAHAILFF